LSAGFDLPTRPQTQQRGFGRPRIRLLADNLLLPYQVAVDHNDVYWVNSGTQLAPGGSVMRISKHGGKAHTVADNLDSPHGMVVDGTSVYWLDTGAFAGTGQWVYFANQSDGTLQSAPR
jgi:hypothetical protein